MTSSLFGTDNKTLGWFFSVPGWWQRFAQLGFRLARFMFRTGADSYPRQKMGGGNVTRKKGQDSRYELACPLSMSDIFLLLNQITFESGVDCWNALATMSVWNVWMSSLVFVFTTAYLASLEW